MFSTLHIFILISLPEYSFEIRNKLIFMPQHWMQQTMDYLHNTKAVI
jgi:hypothetical protein